ncbi:MAG: fibronectin type III domain-containing protein, partial [Cytophagales bacterium]|nr:fibronectin type III domain-containing protein [Cytophagales bacterium]
MTKYFTSISITEKVGIPALTEIIRKNIFLLFVLLSTYSTFAQSVSQPSTSNITYQSAIATVVFSPNCTNGGNITFEWSINSDLSNSLTGTYSVGNGSYSRSMTLTSLQPDTRYYWRAIGRSGLNCNQAPAISPTQTFVTSAAPPASLPGVSISSITFDDAYATINYALNANYGTTTSIIKYGTTSGNLFNQLAGISITVTGNAITPGSALLSGLEQNTTYYYQIEATNSAGTTTSTTASFTTAAIVVPQLVTEYTFDNTYYDVNGN